MKGFITPSVPFAERRIINMRIAVTYENGQIFQHFGHTEQFKIYDIADGKVQFAAIANTNGGGHH